MVRVRVLIVDDEEMIRWSIAQTLSAMGHEVAEAGTASDGMKLFHQLLPQVVFLDVRLPDGDGLELLERMKEERGSRVAVIVMTAYHDTSTYSAAMRLGAFEYLKKPFDFDQIALTVAQAAAESTGARV